MRWSADGGTCFAKVAIAGPPHSGKAGVVRSIAARYGVGEVREQCVGGARLVSVGWRIVDALGAGRHLFLTLRTFEGPVVYQAMEEMLVRELDALVFLLDARPPRLQEAWDSIAQTARHARRSGYDLRSIPLALQYHRADAHPGFAPDKVDRWFGVPVDRVPRFMSSSDLPDAEGMAFDVVKERLIRRILEQEKAR